MPPGHFYHFAGKIEPGELQIFGVGQDLFKKTPVAESYFQYLFAILQIHFLQSQVIKCGIGLIHFFAYFPAEQAAGLP